MTTASISLQASRSNRNLGTRESFIKAGLDLFGDYGFDGASTRMLAHQAGANISGIVYYFGGKDGLYQAVLERIVERFNDLTFEVRADSWRRLEGPLEKTETLELIKNLISGLGQAMNEKPKVKNVEKIILREQTDPTPAFSVLYDGYMKDILQLVAALIGRYTGQSANNDEVVVRAHTLVGQFISFVATKGAFLRTLGVKALKAEQNDLVRKVILGNVEACLKSWAEDGAEP